MGKPPKKRSFRATVLISNEPEVCCAPERSIIPLRGGSFWESSPPMGPTENPTNSAERRKARRARHPRTRRCLLKGCDQRFYPRQARQRYCSEGCREAARKWARRKAQETYRGTVAGQQKRNGQSRRYRERVKKRKSPEPQAVDDPTRVITTEHFFRSLLRPARLLRELCTPAAKSFTALLFAQLPACARARPGAGTALETGARFNPEILIRRRLWPYIQRVQCNWSFTNSIGVGSTCECVTRRGSGDCWRRWPKWASKRPSW